MSTSLELYRDLGVLHDSRLGEWASQSIFAFSKNLFPTEFYYELIEIVFSYRTGDFDNSLIFLFGKEWRKYIKINDVKDYIDGIFHYSISSLQLLFTLAFDPESGRFKKINRTNFPELSNELYNKLKDSKREFDNVILQLDDMFCVYLGKDNNDAIAKQLNIVKLLYKYSDYLYTLEEMDMQFSEEDDI